MAYTIRKIQRKSGVVFSAIIKNQRGEHLKSKTFQRKGDAETWAKRIEADTEKKEALGLTGAGMTFADILDEYLMQWKGKDPSHGIRLAHWRRELGTYKIADISTALIRQKLKEFQNGKCKRGDGKGKTALLPKTRAPATVVRYRNILSGVFRYAIQEGYALSNPVSKVPCPAVDNKRVRYLSDDERDSLFDACKTSAWSRLYPLILLATCTGMRKSEMLNLKWRDVDFEQGLAFLATTKNGEPRVTPIPSPALNELKKIRGVGAALVFPSEMKPDQPMEFKKQWYKALEQAGIENFRFHDLRHTAASYLVMRGATLHETAEILGHKDLSTTQRYAHLSTEHKRNVAERVMGKIMGDGI